MFDGQAAITEQVSSLPRRFRREGSFEACRQTSAPCGVKGLICENRHAASSSHANVANGAVSVALIVTRSTSSIVVVPPKILATPSSRNACMPIDSADALISLAVAQL